MALFWYLTYLYICEFIASDVEEPSFLQHHEKVSADSNKKGL